MEWSGLTIFLFALALTFGQLLEDEILLDAQHDFVLKWNHSNGSMDFEVSAKTQGWIAFGFSPNGGMDQSDVMFGFVDKENGGGNITDRFLLANKTHIQLAMDKQQDWTLLAAKKNNTHTTLKFRRKMETCDVLDLPITASTMRVIFALHNQLPFDYLIPLRHQFRGSRSILFLDQSLATHKSAAAAQSSPTMVWNMVMNETVIPEGVPSMYVCKLVRVPDFAQKLHVIQVNPKIEDRNIDMVHHVLATLCSDKITDSFEPKEFRCGIKNGSSATHAVEIATMLGCRTPFAVWGVGGSAFTYPEEAGLPVGPELRGRYIYVEMHYNNPSLKRRVDSSGLELVLTDKLRRYDAGSMVFGPVNYIANWVIPPGRESFTHFGFCHKNCTQSNLPSDGINIFAGFLHSHLAGRKLRLRHIRDGAELPMIIKDEHYDFDYQEIRGVTPRSKVLPGDEIMMECDYSSTSVNTTIWGGMATTDEMCMGTMMYYPKVDLTHCRSMYDIETAPESLGLQDVLNAIKQDREKANLPASHTIVDEQIAMSISRDLFKRRLLNYSWTTRIVDDLQNYYRTANLSTYCGFKGLIQSEKITMPQLAPAVDQVASACLLPKASVGETEQHKASHAQDKQSKSGASSPKYFVTWLVVAVNLLSVVVLSA